MKNNKKGFTLIELLVVIAIIGLLSTLAVVSLNNARQKSRDAKRLSDVKQMQTALELYYSDCSRYPAAITMGTGSIAQGDGVCDGTIVYMTQTPSNPAPQTDGTCPGGDYTYAVNGAADSYTISYCIGVTTQGITGGSVHTATAAGLSD